MWADRILAPHSNLALGNSSSWQSFCSSFQNVLPPAKAERLMKEGGRVNCNAESLRRRRCYELTHVTVKEKGSVPSALVCDLIRDRALAAAVH